jgi:hypothetical protein
MKKLVLMMALVMAVLAVNAQRTSLKVTDIPKSITDYVAKDYVGYVISDATKVVANNVTSFEVTVTKGTMKDILSFDSMGKFLKKVESQAAGAEKKNSAMPKSHSMTKTKPPVKK